MGDGKGEGLGTGDGSGETAMNLLHSGAPGCSSASRVSPQPAFAMRVQRNAVPRDRLPVLLGAWLGSPARAALTAAETS